jgi:hypothetical protein
MKNLRVLLPILLLTAGCETAAPPPLAAVAPPRAGFARGIDLPIDARDVSQELKGSGVDFVARYYRYPTSRWPTLTAEEARSVAATGMKLVTLFESHSHRPDYFNYQSGFSDGLTAYQQARRIGQPAGSAIYFAVDYNAPQNDIAGPIDRYFRGVRAGLFAASGGKPEYRIGVYGSGAVCDYMKRMRLAQFAWLSGSTAWAGYDRFTDWNIRQGKTLPSLSFNHDINEARDDYGGFTVPTQYSAL